MYLRGTAPEHIWDILYGNHRGTVDMVNSRGIYLNLAGRKILLCSRHYGVVPNGAAVEDWNALPPLLEVGQPIRAKGGILQFPRVAAELDLEKAVQDADIVTPSLNGVLPLLQSKETGTGLAPLSGVFFGHGEPVLNPWCRMALPPLQALLNALEKGNSDAIAPSVGALLGLGTGLTPSGDDVLAGLLYGLRHSVLRDADETLALRDAICVQANGKTTAVSTDVLLALAQDAPFERMKGAWQGSAERLLEIGSNSGSEMLLGLTLAELLLNKKG